MGKTGWVFKMTPVHLDHEADEDRWVRPLPQRSSTTGHRSLPRFSQSSCHHRLGTGRMAAW